MKQSLVNRLLLLRFFAGLKTRQPKLFYFCLTLTALQLLFTAAKLEITPFMLYGMYSEKYAPATTLSRHQVVVGSQPLSSLNLYFREKMYLQTIAENYLLQWLLAHPVQAHSLWIFMIFLELVFLVGFITLRFDKWIGLAYLFFALGGWYFFDVWNYENLLFLLTLYPAIQWMDRLSQKTPKIGP